MTAVEGGQTCRRPSLSHPRCVRHEGRRRHQRQRPGDSSPADHTHPAADQGRPAMTDPVPMLVPVLVGPPRPTPLPRPQGFRPPQPEPTDTGSVIEVKQ